MEKRIVGVAAATSLTFIALTPLAFASPEGDNLVINEVYTAGAGSNNQYLDYVELYNPTAQAISIDGWSLQYFSKAGTKSSQNISLQGSIAANGYYLIVSTDDQKPGFTPLYADVSGDLRLSKTDGTVVLFNTAETQTLANPANTVDLANIVDAFGWGSKAGIRENSAETEKVDSATSFHRLAAGKDTDNNDADFNVANPDPMNSAGDARSTIPANVGGATGESGDVETPAVPTDPVTPPSTTQISISEIQGTGSASSFVNQKVSTTGVVTAAYPTGGFNGVYIQTPGAPSEVPEASQGLFIYSSKMAQSVQIGDYVEVIGTVAEYAPSKSLQNQTITQLKDVEWKVISDAAKSVQPLQLQQVPAGDAEREKLEGMLVQITGDYTVTNNYDTNRYGQVGLAAGLSPLAQPSDLYNPSTNLEEVKQVEAANAAKLITLDDGVSRDLTKETAIPASYLDVQNPIRVGAQVKFKKPMIIEHRYQWNLQPTEPVVAAAENNKPAYNHSFDQIELQNNARPAAPDKLGGAISLASFNVLNYFTDLGEAEAGCGGYRDQDGDFVTANNCSVRGAYTKAAFERQQTKIVAAINELDASVLGLEEIENSAQYGHERDASLNTLVQALNQAAGSEKWAVVPSPDASQIPVNEDVIRLAFIYQPALVETVGDSQILDDQIFNGVARQPLAQKFRVKGGSENDEFVVVVNHFKSKGSLSNKISDDTDVYQGNNNKLRTAQAQTLTQWISEKFTDDAVFIIGDLNSYSQEDPVIAIENAGFTNLAEKFAVTARSYQYDGLVGSLDHALANAKAVQLATGAQVWNVNAMEPIAFEYSRYNYNVAFERLFDSSAFRSSDHDPIKVGLFAVQEAEGESGLSPDISDGGESIFPADNPTDSADSSGGGANSHASTLKSTGAEFYPVLMLALLFVTAGSAVLLRRRKI